MKKVLIIFVTTFIFLLSKQTIFAAEYLTYQNITFTNHGGLLLENYTKSDYENYYKRIKGNRFWGWKTYVVLQNEPITFQKETMYIIRNEGYSTISKNYFFKTTEQSKFQLSATGNVGISASGNIKAFKLGLDSHIRPTVSYETQRAEEERIEIRMQIDPMTVLYVEVYGEGKITNGVAKYYRFWRNVRTGGWEVFVLTTEYFSIVKERIIDESIPEERDDNHLY
ncbi:MAG: hypothetical protein ACNA7U_01395 [Candidatus Izemoplasmataceae bacterium]|jgi:hypothetical protein|uniref:hypothetical protein n=1 Tax=Liberiplasma polymorphum TaxID=3374570 RepID=UPI003775FBD9